MKSPKHTKLIITVSLLLILSYACKKESENPSVKIKSVTVKNEGVFNFTGGLTYAVIDSLSYDINIETEPAGAPGFFSINGGEIQLQNTDYNTVDSNDKYISFFANSSGICMEGNNRLDFVFEN